MSEFKTIELSIEEQVARLTFNRPSKKNSMSPRLFVELSEACDQIDDSGAKVTVVTGNGDAFNAGMDLEKFFREPEQEGPERMYAVSEISNEAYADVYSLRTPTIARIHGYTFGGGYTIQALCDVSIAADDAEIGLSEINWGISPGGGASWSLVNTMGMRDAAYYGLTGETMTGKEAAEIGAVTKAVPRDQLDSEVDQLVQVLLEKDRIALEYTKRVLKLVNGLDFDDAKRVGDALTAEMRNYQSESGADQALEKFASREFRPGKESY